MPEHVHLLISEPMMGNVSSVMCAIKLGFSRRIAPQEPHFWPVLPEVGLFVDRSPNNFSFR
jgi:REP element-mobilizing transposase RayT